MCERASVVAASLIAMRASLEATSLGEASKLKTTSTEHGSGTSDYLVRGRVLGMRHLQVTLAFLSMFIAFTLRVNLSVAIVAMVDKEGANPAYPEYDWDSVTQSLLLSAFSWGYFILQIPAGVMAERFGPKVMLAVSQLVTACFSILSPLAAATGGWRLLFAARFIQGVAQGIIMPSTHAFLARWVPVRERGTLVTITYSGGVLGTVLALALSGTIATSSGGWPAIFYLFGGLGIVWTVLWTCLGADHPGLDQYITDDERAYIQNSLYTKEKLNTKRLATPWKAILTSPPVWAIIVASGGNGLGFWTLLTETPTYLKTVLGYDLQANALLSALPYLAMFFLSIPFCLLSDFLNNRHVTTLTFSRKLFNTIGLIVPAVSLIALSYSLDTTLSVVLLTIAVGFNGAVLVGFNINHIDLAPNFAGTMMGLSNSLENIVGCLGPLIVGAVVTESGSTSQWRIVFYIAAAVYFFTAVFYVVFGNAELQQWNDPQQVQDQQAAEGDSMFPTRQHRQQYGSLNELHTST